MTSRASSPSSTIPSHPLGGTWVRNRQPTMCIRSSSEMVGLRAEKPPPVMRCATDGEPMRLSLMPRKSIFFAKFSEHASNSLKAARALDGLLRDFTDVERQVRDIRALEHDGDELTHEIIENLNAAFVTPLDREDILGLASRLDDVVDLAHDAAELVLLYDLREVRPQAVRQVEILVSAADGIVEMMNGLERFQGLEPHWIKLHTLEKEGDQAFRDAVGELFASETDPAEIIKWKDLYELLESAIDRCEDVANIVETIAIKHA
ncbi:MAG: DUF47 domain-containing protein [Chloroflexi bacterium]|nr:MAG: DUF47 domain-containing protein [Chloroflexota bacterium]